MVAQITRYPVDNRHYSANKSYLPYSFNEFICSSYPPDKNNQLIQLPHSCLISWLNSPMRGLKFPQRGLLPKLLYTRSQRWKKLFSFWDPGLRITKFLQIFQEANWQNNPENIFENKSMRLIYHIIHH